MATRVEHQHTNIQERYVPRLAGDPRLDGQFERIRRGCQDAVAARDMAALARTRDLKNTFFEQLASAPNAVDPAEAAALRSAIDDYYAASYDVSQRLIAGTTGEAVVDAMTAMQAKDARAAILLKKATSIDKRELTAAFSAGSPPHLAAGHARLFLGIACLLAMMFLSLW